MTPSCSGKGNPKGVASNGSACERRQTHARTMEQSRVRATIVIAIAQQANDTAGPLQAPRRLGVFATSSSSAADRSPLIAQKFANIQFLSGVYTPIHNACLPVSILPVSKLGARKGGVLETHSLS